MADDLARSACSRSSRSSAASSTCRSFGPQLDFSRSGWSRPSKASARCTSRRSRVGFVLSTVAVIIAVVGIVSGRAMYRNGLPEDRGGSRRRAARAVRQGARQRVLLRRRDRPLRQRPAHRRGALHQRRRRPQGHRRRGERRGGRVQGGRRRFAQAADRLGAQLRARGSCSARCCSSVTCSIRSVA